MIAMLRRWRRSRAEVQTCPDRVGSLGPWTRNPNQDAWVRDRWGTAIGRRLSWWYHNGPIGNWLRALNHRLWEQGRHRLRHWLPNPGQGGSRWQWWWYPRTCTFCGGVHPEDAIALLYEGWSVDRTGKVYKRYLNPPGWHPTPPVKLYTWHFSESDITRFNAAQYP